MNLPITNFWKTKTFFPTRPNTICLTYGWLFWKSFSVFFILWVVRRWVSLLPDSPLSLPLTFTCPLHFWAAWSNTSQRCCLAGISDLKKPISLLLYVHFLFTFKKNFVRFYLYPKFNLFLTYLNYLVSYFKIRRVLYFCFQVNIMFNPLYVYIFKAYLSRSADLLSTVLWV